MLINISKVSLRCISFSLSSLNTFDIGLVITVFLIICHVTLNAARLTSSRDLLACSIRNITVQKQRMEKIKFRYSIFSKFLY